MTKFYQVGRCTVCLEADRDFSDSEQTKPFLCKENENFFRITFKGETEFPAFAGEPVFRSSSVRVYNNNGKEERVYVLPASDKAAAVITGKKDGCLCRYDVKQAEYFSKAVHLLNTVGLERIAFDCGMYYLHCSFIELDGKAVLFSGSSGVGKSTRAEMFEKYAGARIINHDKALLYFENGSVIASGSPIAGSSSVYINEAYPVEAIVFLKKGSGNKTVRLRPADAIRSLVKNTVINTWDQHFYRSAVAFAADCVSTLRVFGSECSLSEQSVEEQRKGMKI